MESEVLPSTAVEIPVRSVFRKLWPKMRQVRAADGGALEARVNK